MGKKIRSILEVWDYRLSTAQPMNYRGQMPTINEAGEMVLEACDNWVACVYDKVTGELLEAIDTGEPVKPGDLHDGAGIDACFAFYRKVRDKYSREDIEEIKPKVALLRAALFAAHKLLTRK